MTSKGLKRTCTFLARWAHLADEQVTIEVIRRHKRSGKSYGGVADYLNAQNYPTKRGGKWSSSTVFAICKRLQVS